MRRLVFGKDPTAPKDIQTEVIFLPACSYLEREGTMINSMRILLRKKIRERIQTRNSVRA